MEVIVGAYFGGKIGKGLFSIFFEIYLTTSKLPCSFHSFEHHWKNYFKKIGNIVLVNGQR